VVPAEEDIIEKIDIGGISLIRASRQKIYKDHSLCVSSMNDYDEVLEMITKAMEALHLEDRRTFCTKSFNVSFTLRFRTY